MRRRRHPVLPTANHLSSGYENPCVEEGIGTVGRFSLLKAVMNFSGPELQITKTNLSTRLQIAYRHYKNRKHNLKKFIDAIIVGNTEAINCTGRGSNKDCHSFRCHIDKWIKLLQQNREWHSERCLTCVLLRAAHTTAQSKLVEFCSYLVDKSDFLQGTECPHSYLVAVTSCT